MELEKLFEEIYALSNHTTEYGTNYLEWPLDTATKPPMYLNESKLFEEIYFEHRLKPLFEQVLREMAISSESNFVDNISNKIKSIILSNENKKYWEQYNNGTINMSNEFLNELGDSLRNIVTKFINDNDKPHLTNPFVVMNPSGHLLIYRDSDIEKMNSYISILQKYIGTKVRVGAKNIIKVIGIIQIKESSDDEIRQWVRNGISKIKKYISLNTGHLLLPNNYENIRKFYCVSLWVF